MFFVGSGYGFWIHPIFYTEPDPGKLYGFHGSGSATLTTRIIMTKSLTSHRFATGWMVLSPVARPGRQDTELPHLGEIFTIINYILLSKSVWRSRPPPHQLRITGRVPEPGYLAGSRVFGWNRIRSRQNFGPDPAPASMVT